MTSTTVPEEAVKAAARELCRFGTSFSTMEATKSWVDEKWPRFKEEATRALTAALPFLPVQGAVKKLEWVAHKGDQHCKIAWTCEGIGGWYAIEHRHEGHFDMWTPNNPDGGRFITLEAAKAAAQADYEARILSALEPSARELAFYEGDDICARLEGLASWLDGSQHSKWCGRKEVPIHGYSGEGKLVRAAIAAIRALSSPDHADAGKVEGDGWPTGEYEVDYEVICNGEWVAGSTDLNDAKHYAAVYSHDGEIEIVEARTYRRPIPSAPSEGAE